MTGRHARQEEGQQMPDAAAQMIDAAAGLAKGQDRSSFQEIGSWTGCDFGVAKATEGLHTIDSTFEANWRNLREEKKMRGAYHFWHPADSPSAQASLFVGRVKAEGLADGDFLVGDIEITVGADGALVMSPHALRRSSMLDTDSSGRIMLAEGVESQADPQVVMTTSQLAEKALEFLEAVHALAPRNGLFVYTNLSVGSQLGPCSRFPLWIAFPATRPPVHVPPWTRYDLWQYAFSGGFDNCDRDMASMSAAELRKLLMSFAPEPKPKPAAATAPATTDEEDMGSGVFAAGHGKRETHSWLQGDYLSIALVSDWKGVQASAPEGDLRVMRLEKGADAAVKVKIPEHGTCVFKIDKPADVNGFSFERTDTGEASISWHVNATA
jgi:GH25 family lysozyme M1 (1,4-beta-N-acetylmuramidase)